MVLFSAFSNGADIHRFHIFQIAVVLALWGVVISAVYMLRAYRAAFLGPLNDELARLPLATRTPRLPVVVLVAVSIFVGFFPQNVARLIAPVLRPQTAQR
jgi:NADH-quinone oxidoreductase subunit M